MQLALLALLINLVLEVIREVAGESKVSLAHNHEELSTSTEALSQAFSQLL